MQFIPDYIEGKQEKKKITFLHPKLKPILESTYGIPLYQEQIMKIVRELAGFTLTEADVLRKAIGKKIKKLLMDQKEKFINGCKKNKIDESIAIQIWHWIEPFAQYSFNRSHGATYALIAYQTAYLKTHFPVEFMASLLTSEKQDVERVGFLIEECKKMGIEVLPPDINESFAFFSVVPKKNQIRFGLLVIKNVGSNLVEAIVEERKKSGHYLSIENFFGRIDLKYLNKKSLESLIKAGAFDKMIERNQFLFNLEKLLELSRENQKSKNSGQRGLFDGHENMANIKFQLSPAKPASKTEKLNWEKELLGLFVTSHPLEGFKNIFSKKTLSIEKVKNDLGLKLNNYGFPAQNSNQFIKILGLISSIKKIITKNGKPMLFMNLEDLSDKIEVVVFPGVIERNPTAFQENKIVLVSGRVDNRDNVPKLICKEIEEILES